jgi:uncharacterized membrane protein YdbT with pleckstrin-like domain
MVVAQAQIVEFLKSLYLFRGLADEQIAQIANMFTVGTLAEGERLFTAGDLAEHFYIIQSGSVLVSYEFEGGERTKDILVAGDFFGEESLLYRRPCSVSITAAEPTQLLSLDILNFYRLVREYPKVRAILAKTAESLNMARSHRFQWLNEKEIVYQIRRKHEVVLLISLLGPIFFGLLSLAVLLFISNPEISESLWTVGAWAAATFFFIALAWGLWAWIDWSNDYYIITDQRVVWIEKVIWLYESRREAPLSTVLAVSQKSSWFGQIIGYGDVTVRTFTGQVVFHNVGQPQQMAAMIEEYWHRIQSRTRQEEQEATERAIRRVLFKDGDTPPEKRDAAAAPDRVQYQEPSLWQKYFGDFFKMRFEENNVITYRKYWTVLLSKVWLPTLAILVLSAGLVYFTASYLTGEIESPSPDVVLSIGLFVLFFMLVPWWIYHYVDWRNDIYQVTDRNIFDIERRPLGTELRKSAPLDNILSLEHERVGLLGYLLNYGNVTINVGETQFVFLGVYDPASVQQEIFDRMYSLRRQKELAEIARERDRVVSMIETYHRNQEHLRE